MPTTREKLASQAYWLTGWGLIMPIDPGAAVETSEMAHVQGLYAGLTYATGAPAVADVSEYRITWGRRRGR